MSELLQNYLDGFGVHLSLFGIIWYLLYVIGLWKVFTKAGERGWYALIPFYNTYIMYKISWRPSMFWINIIFGFAGLNLLTFTNGVFLTAVGVALSFVTFLMYAVENYNMSIAYGHGFPFFLGLLLFQPIFIMILGYGSSRYLGNRYR